MQHFLQILSVACVSFVLGACTMNNSNRVRTESSALGAGIGATLGYFAAGKKGAAIGAALGGAAGLAGGHYMAKRKEHFADTQDFIRSEIVYVEQVTREIQAQSRQVSQEIALFNQKITQLRQLLTQRRMTQAQLDQEKAALARRYSQSYQVYQNAKAELDKCTRMYQQYAAQGQNPAEVQQWRQRLASLQQEKSVLQTRVAQLSNMYYGAFPA